TVTEPARTKPLTDDVLATAAGESVSGVHRIATELGVAVKDRVAGFQIDVPAELGSAQHEGECLDACVADRDANGLADAWADHGNRCRGMRQRLLVGARGLTSCPCAEQSHPSSTPAGLPRRP